MYIAPVGGLAIRHDSYVCELYIRNLGVGAVAILTGLNYTIYGKTMS